jgi:tetratricopeptide (TPR) repeat protein
MSMNTPLMKSIVRDTWYLFVLLAVILASAVYFFLREKAAPVSSEAVTSLTADGETTLGENAAPQTPVLIAEYQRRLDDDPKDPNAPVLLNAMGNLTRQKFQDYKEAARYYELLINDYPQWERIASVYPQLATCYERLNDLHNLQWVYKAMMERFPADSQEYLYAKQELGLQ